MLCFTILAIIGFDGLKKSVILISHTGTPQKLEMICTDDLQILLKVVTDARRTRGVENRSRNTFGTIVRDRKNTAARKVQHDFENSIASCLIICILLFVNIKRIFRKIVIVGEKWITTFVCVYKHIKKLNFYFI